MAEIKYAPGAAESMLTPGQAGKSLASNRQMDITHALVFRAIGSQDLGLQVNQEYGWDLLKRIGINPFMLQNVMDLLTQVGCDANKIYDASIARFSNNSESALRIVPVQALKLEEKLERHLYN